MVFDERTEGFGNATIVTLVDESILELEKISTGLVWVLLGIPTIRASENTVRRLPSPLELL